MRRSKPSLVAGLLVAAFVALSCGGSATAPPCCYESQPNGAFFCACGTTQGSTACSVTTSGSSCTISCTTAGKTSTLSGRVVQTCSSPDGG